MSSGSAGIGDDHFRSFLADHVDRRDDEEPGNTGEHRSVDDPQPVNAVHAEPAVDHGKRIGRRAHLAGATGVMTPRVIADPLADLSAGANPLTRRNLPLDDLAHAPSQPTRLLDADHHRLEILAGGVIALLEVRKVDRWRLGRVCRGETDRAGSVPRVSLEDYPREACPFVG